jgi:3-oxoadipate enol-lactonase
MLANELDGQAVLFIHGIGGGGRAWAGQLASFRAAGLNPMAPDLPGYGGRRAVTTMGFEGLAEDVETFIAESRVHRPVLVGHSMGGMIAQTMLRRRRTATAPVLACTSPPSAMPTETSRGSSWPTAWARSTPARPWPTSRPGWSTA